MLTVIISLLLASGAADALPPAQPIPPTALAATEILSPIKRLFEAFEAGDSAAMLRLVYPEGRVTTTGTRASGSGLRQMSWTQFAQRVKPDDPFSETITDPIIKIDGDIALVWAPFIVRVGGKVSNCGVDHFDMVRENGAWKIMNLTFSSRIAGCPGQ